MLLYLTNNNFQYEYISYFISKKGFVKKIITNPIIITVYLLTNTKLVKP